MSTSERTMSQVRAILQRLDRSIDEAREKRTHPAPQPAAMAPMATAQPAAPAAPANGTAPQPGTSSRPPSPFGRAQPLNRPAAPRQPLRWGS